MENELYDKPGLIITDKVIRTTKVKKFIEKHKLTDYKIIYLDPIPDDFRDVEKALKDLENSYLGLGPSKEKQKIVSQTEYEYEYRINRNTVLAAHSQEDLDRLKKWWNVK